MAYTQTDLATLRAAIGSGILKVRYADGVNVPGAVGTRWYAEFRTPQDGSVAATCYQWRYDTAAG